MDGAALNAHVGATSATNETTAARIGRRVDLKAVMIKGSGRYCYFIIYLGWYDYFL